MSNKTKTTATKEEAKPALVPKLRFPEFRDAEGWTEKPLKAAAHINPSNDGLPESFVYIDLESVDAGKLNAKERISRAGAPSRAQRLVERGDIIYQVVRPYQRNNLLCEFDDDDDYVASTGYAQLRAKGSNRFLYQSIHIDSFVGKVIAKCTGSNYPAINSSDLAEIHLPIPPTLPEQQRIAECLSSADELMAAQARKVDALKTHKKGLMQQLFPREGETQPRLRFPEFQNAGEWEVQRLDELARYENGKAHENDISENGPYIVVNSKFISTEGEVRKFSNEAFCVADEGDVLMVLSDVPNGRAIAKCYFVESDDLYTVNQRICRIQPTKVNGRFLFYVLNRNSYFLDFDDGVKQTNLRKEDVVGFPLCVPPQPDEQQKIAECLSSLDALITAETQKHEALKTHKKGLMQQLFPSVQEAAA
ncbi:MAG: restriction endonuclease subunit S [Aquimonas sp.]|nr:restriction endonuclease subunit S [Aquimonas sp.]